MPSQPTGAERQLMIKVKACQRIRKEVDYYLREVKDNEAELQAMKEDASKDPYDIKKFEEVVGESRMMVPDSQRRLEAAVQDLQQCLEEQQSTSNNDASSEWQQAAVQLLEKEKALTTTGNNDGAVDPPSTSTNTDNLAEGEAF